MYRHFDGKGHHAGIVIQILCANVFIAFHDGLHLGEFYSADAAMSAVERAHDFQ
jgi:hypothetical protein